MDTCGWGENGVHHLTRIRSGIAPETFCGMLFHGSGGRSIVTALRCSPGWCWVWQHLGGSKCTLHGAAVQQVR